MKITIESKVGIGFIVSLLIIVLFSVNAFFNMRGLIRENREQQEVQLVLKSVDSVKYNLIVAESSGRLYALTGQESYHAAYTSSMQHAGFYINTLVDILLSEKKYRAQKDTLTATFQHLVAFGDKIIRTRHFQGTNAALELFLNGQLAEDANKILFSLQKIETMHRDRMTATAENNIAEANNTILSFLLLVAVIFILLAVCYRWLKKDLALRRKAERALLRLNEELESRVRTRTAQLEENEEKLSYKVNELNTFMYKATHDLRSPLVSLMGLIRVAENEINDNPELKEYFGMIDKSVMNMERLLLDLVSITNVSQGTLVVNKIDFTAMVSKVLTSLQHYPDFESIRISKNINEAIPFYGDDKLLYSLLQNLIDNAIKYRKINPEEPSVVNISVESNAQSVIINISDNGIGIPAKAQEKVFDMFFRATTLASGTGLGLYIVKNSVEKMKGQITLKNLETGGTSIYVTLPNTKTAATND